MLVTCIIIIIYPYSQPVFRLTVTSDNNLPLFGIIKDFDEYHFAFFGHRQAFVFELRKDGTLHIIDGLRRYDGNLTSMVYFIKQKNHIKVKLSEQEIEELIKLAERALERGSTTSLGGVLAMQPVYVFLSYKGEVIVSFHGDKNELLDRCESYSPFEIKFNDIYT